MKLKLLIPVYACAILTLSGCKPSDRPAASAYKPVAVSQPKTPVADAPTEDQRWAEKAQSYIKINNRLDRFTTPFNEAFAKGAAEAVDQVNHGNFKAINSGGLTYFDDTFVKAVSDNLAKPGDMPSVDAAARSLLETTQKYVPNWQALADYDKAKKYEDDNGAKGKQMLPMYREGIEKIGQAVRVFSDQVDVIARQSNEKMMARYKAEGKLLELDELEAMTAARAIADIFNSPADFKDKSKIDKANAQLEVMETRLAGMRAEHEKRKTDSPKTLPVIDRYDSIYSSLTDFAGKYRESRKAPGEFKGAVKKFNDAIEASNMMMRG